MKVQLDFDNKTISVESQVNLGEFMEKIKKLIPEWKEWKLQTNTVINNWTNPIVIDRYPDHWPELNPYNPFWYDNPAPYKVTCNINSQERLTGSYNFELN